MLQPDIRQRIRDNWQQVVDGVDQAARDAGRDPSSIRIVGVSKYVDAETAMALVDAGCERLGESRPQELWQKAEHPGLRDRVEWHLIGHLQRNKVRRTLRYRPLIHSADSPRLLAALQEEATAQGIELPLLLEVNISGEAAKTGLSPEAVEPLLDQFPGNGVRVIGLMAMAGWGTEAAEARRQFAEVRRLRDRLRDRTGRDLPELSMGMSGDFPAAIAEGATIVRIGSRLFTGVLPESQSDGVG